MMNRDATDINVGDTIYRRDAIDAIYKCTDIFVNNLPVMVDKADAYKALSELPSAQPEDWMERNEERILQAGMEGREIEFRIGGRLFAIREKAQ